MSDLADITKLFKQRIVYELKPCYSIKLSLTLVIGILILIVFSD